MTAENPGRSRRTLVGIDAAITAC
ncbi:transposase, partial [Mycobacterium tuberculosis TKK_04_0148]